MIIFFFLFITGVNAESLHGDIDPASHDPVASVRSNCIDGQDWSSKTCTVGNNQASHYQTDMINDGLGLIGGSTIYALSELAGMVGEVVSYGVYQEPSIGAARRSQVLDLLNGVLTTQALNACQKACLVKCATNNILKYQHYTPSKLGPTSEVYRDGVGVCTEYQKVAWDLGSSIGLDVNYAFGYGHAFNSFKIDGEWYLAEPHESSCQFFTRAELDRSQLDERTTTVNAGPRAVTPQGWSFNLPSYSGGITR